MQPLRYAKLGYHPGWVPTFSLRFTTQADSCHAYQLMLKSGVPAENIILMMQDVAR